MSEKDRNADERVESESEAKDEDSSSSAPPLRKVDKAIGEERDNLKRRQDWFRRRSGGGGSTS